MKLLIASGNQGKIKEFQALLEPFGFEVLAAEAAGYDMNVIEDQDSFLGNAKIKAMHLYQQAQIPVLADDSGLVLEAFPDLLSVHSARFMANESYTIKNQALLEKYENEANRKAYFETALVLILDKPYYFTGRIQGKIAKEAQGNSGFGYDPIFIPDGYCQTFAELGATVKDKISHRAQATQALYEFLKERIDE